MGDNIQQKKQHIVANKENQQKEGFTQQQYAESHCM